MLSVNGNLNIIFRKIGLKFMIIKGMVHNNIDKWDLSGIKKRNPFRIDKIILPGTAVKIETDCRRNFWLAKPNQVTKTSIFFALIKIKDLIAQQFKGFSQLLRKKPQGFNPLCK